MVRATELERHRATRQGQRQLVRRRRPAGMVMSVLIRKSAWRTRSPECWVRLVNNAKVTDPEATCCSTSFMVLSR